MKMIQAIYGVLWIRLFITWVTAFRFHVVIENENDLTMEAYSWGKSFERLFMNSNANLMKLDRKTYIIYKIIWIWNDRDSLITVVSPFWHLAVTALLVSSEVRIGNETCKDGLGLNYTLPMFNECKEKRHSNGSMVQTIPKIIPALSAKVSHPRRDSIPGHRVCRFPGNCIPFFFFFIFMYYILKN